MSDFIQMVRSFFGVSRPAAKPIRRAAPSTTSSVPSRATPARRAHKTISSLDGLPTNHGIVTNSEGKHIVRKSDRQYYVALFSDQKKQSAFVVASLDKKVDTIDHSLLEIRQRLKEAEIVPGGVFYASTHIIERIYARYSGAATSVEDQGKVKLEFMALVERALSEDVSDIHIEVRRDAAALRFRKKGDLVHVDDMSVNQATDMATVVYNVLAEDKDLTFQKNNMQDAVIDVTVSNGQRVRIRLATTPAAPDGFDMVLRVLPTGTQRNRTLEDLGYTTDQVKALSLAVAQPVGIIIVAGITGSGKSTSLACMLTNKIEDAERKIKVITVENPPENIIDGATQVPVVLARDGKNNESPFAKAIRAAMRLDPDVLMIGEIRDEDSADLAVHATQSGHQALATLHASSAFAVPGRLRSIGIHNDVLGSNGFFAGIVYQALVQLTCPNCKLGYEEWLTIKRTDAEQMLHERIERVFPPKDRQRLAFRNKTGCSHCEGGIIGREVVAEVVVPDREMRELFAEGRDGDAEKLFLRQGGLTVLQVGLEKVRAGHVDVRDLEKKLGLIDEVLELARISGRGMEALGYNETHDVDIAATGSMPGALALSPVAPKADVVPHRQPDEAAPHKRPVDLDSEDDV